MRKGTIFSYFVDSESQFIRINVAKVIEIEINATN